MDTRNESAIEITYEEFKEIINNSHKLIVVDFFAEWCMPCLMLSPIIEELAKEVRDVKFVKINIDENRELTGKLGISSIPCLIFFKDGREVDRIIGNQIPENIKKKLKKCLKNGMANL